MSDNPEFRFDSDGVLNVDFGVMREMWREPICPECWQPIRWVMDMASWTGAPHQLAHARCVWRKEAFTRERDLAPDDL